MKPTASILIRGSGVAALLAGVIFAGIQPIHPPDVLASVTTSAWAIITSLKTAMCLLLLLGITRLHARQVDKAGWLGVAGFVLVRLSWGLQTAFVFAKSFIFPPLATTAPQFVEAGLTTLTRGEVSMVNLGALPLIYSLGVGLANCLDGLVFGIATFRAGVLPRWPAGLLAITAALTILAAPLPSRSSAWRRYRRRSLWPA